MTYARDLDGSHLKRSNGNDHLCNALAPRKNQTNGFLVVQTTTRPTKVVVFVTYKSETKRTITVVLEKEHANVATPSTSFIDVESTGLLYPYSRVDSLV